MRRRTYIIAAIVVVALAGALTAGLALAADQDAALPTLTPAELLATVAQEAPNTTSVSGDIAWTNDVLGAAALALAGNDGGLGTLLLGGTAGIWYQEGNVRVESDGPAGSMTAVLNGRTLWVYSSAEGTATEYTLPEWPEAAAGGSGASASGGGDAALPWHKAGLDAADLPAKIQEMVDELAPHATLAVDTGTVAGRDAYILVLTPTASEAAIQTVQAAFDGETFLPLRAQVFATGASEPVLEAGFTTVSFDPVSADTFDFTPPAGVAVERTTVTLPDFESHKGDLEKMHEGVKPEWKEPLTLDEASAEAGFALVAPAEPTLTFQGARVVTVPVGEFPVGDFLGGESGAGAGDGHEWPALGADGPATVAFLKYGEGFGTIVVLETEIDDADWAEITSMLAQVPLFGIPKDFGGREVYEFGTPLGTMVAWRQGDVVVVAGGSVTRGALEAFVGGMPE